MAAGDERLQRDVIYNSETVADRAYLLGTKILRRVFCVLTVNARDKNIGPDLMTLSYI